MKKLMQLFLPKEKELYELFKDISLVCVEMSQELDKLLKEYNKMERIARKEKILEIKLKKLFAEELHLKITKKLDRGNEQNKRILEKISDDILDSCKLLHAGASSLFGMGIERIDGQMIKFCEILVEAAAELSKCINEMRKAKNVKEHCKNIHKLERQADDLFRESMSELFHFFKNSLDIIKYKNFYEGLEKTADKINSCAILISRIE